MINNIQFKRNTKNVNWLDMKNSYILSDWDTGRTPEQLKKAFDGSYTVCFSYINTEIIGTARAISDGVDSAAVYDVWIKPEYRDRGIGKKMMTLLLADLHGQYILLTTRVYDFYKKFGFEKTDAMVINN